ncbi:hypothetical protein [Acidovorax sp.]|uniref:hypothetical protein n=1 Tax=Acidovorax sp. TaxID=1872122 RepID=UPI00391EF84D
MTPEEARTAIGALGASDLLAYASKSVDNTFYGVNSFANLIKISSGTEAAPGLAFYGEANTGIYRDDDWTGGKLHVAIKGAKALSLDPTYGANSFLRVTPGTGEITVTADSTASSASLKLLGKGGGTVYLGSTNAYVSGIGALTTAGYFQSGGSYYVGSTTASFYPVVTGTQGFASAEVSAGNSGTAKTITWTTGQNQTLTLTGNATITLSTPTNGATYKLRLVQDATGSRTVTFSPTPKWAGGTAPTFSTAANAVDIVTLYWNGTNYFAQAGMGFA